MKNIFLVHNIKLLVSLLVICSLCFSCKKWVEIPAPKDRITSDVVFSDSSTVMTAIAGIYYNFGYFNNINSTSINGWYLSVYPGLSSDELLPSNAWEFEINSLKKENSIISSLWSTGYSSIYRVNACIEGINESEGIRAELKQRLIAEMKVLRALNYFHLINLYGGVPIVTTTDYAVNTSLSRAPVNDVYQQIVTDLTDARQYLKAGYPSTGRARPNLYTATALLAKVYLYQQNWTGAETMAKEVINSGLYSIVSDLNNVFLSGSTEAIWQLPTAGGANVQTQEGYGFVPANTTSIPSHFLTPSLLNAFESGDQRRIKWVGTNNVGANMYYYPLKYKNRVPTAIPREDYMLFRLAEQYLVLAEALAQQNKLSEAQPYLNQIRNRAGLIAVNPTTQTDMLNAIMQERRIELFCERGNRWFDLKRTGKANTALGALKPGTWQPEDTLYPIPFSEILYNPNLVQNPGYN